MDKHASRPEIAKALGFDLPPASKPVTLESESFTYNSDAGLSFVLPTITAAVTRPALALKQEAADDTELIWQSLSEGMYNMSITAESAHRTYGKSSGVSLPFPRYSILLPYFYGG